MIIGQTILPNSGTNHYYTPWFPRQGDAGEFAIQLIDFYDSAGSPAWQLKANIETKNSEEIDSSAAPLGSGVTVDAPAAATIYTATFSGAEELVRIRFTLAGVVAADWACVRALNVSWASN